MACRPSETTAIGCVTPAAAKACWRRKTSFSSSSTSRIAWFAASMVHVVQALGGWLGRVRDRHDFPLTYHWPLSLREKMTERGDPVNRREQSGREFRQPLKQRERKLSQSA